MREVTAWKIYKTISNDGVEQNVLVAYDPVAKKGIVEVVNSNGAHTINENYKLVGSHNIYFEEYASVWGDWITQNNINTIYDISSQFE